MQSPDRSQIERRQCPDKAQAEPKQIADGAQTEPRQSPDRAQTKPGRAQTELILVRLGNTELVGVAPAKRWFQGVPELVPEMDRKLRPPWAS
jgi:hypothetical protein